MYRPTEFRSRPALFASLFITLCVGVVSCGGSDNNAPVASAPGAVQNITVNAGDGVISLGWQPPASDGGAPISGYTVSTSAPVSEADITVSGTRAMIGNLTNDIPYDVSVVAINGVGEGALNAPASFMSRAASPANYTAISITGDPASPSGIYDPSLLRNTAGDLWLSYSSVHFYTDGNGDIVQDVGIRVARSTDNGNSFAYVNTLATPFAGSVTDSDPEQKLCGTAQCTGCWVYETSWLVEDTSDPDPNRRFKLFAHRYFLYPPATGSRTIYHLGSIVMWTAAAPDGAWSSEQTLLGWPASPIELQPALNATSLHAELANCVVFSEGGITVNARGLEFVFACPYFDTAANDFLQKIVLLRSSDHGASFSYVSTLLTPADAPAGIDQFSAPALVVGDNTAPLLLVTPMVSGLYTGSMVFALGSGGDSVIKPNGQAQALITLPVQASGHVGGASTYARGTGTLGVLQSDATLAVNLVDTQFRIVATGGMLEQ